MSKSAERVARLSPQEQRALLAETLRKKASKPRLAPASFAQERLWFLDQLEPGNPSYNMPVAVHLCGRLDVVALGRSLNEIVRRHEALRTIFATDDGRPVQVIAPFVASPLAVVDLRSCPEMRRETEARRLIAAEVHRPFDLAQGPLFRASLLCLDDACPEQGRREQHVFLLNVSHIVSDGWSQGVLLRELAALYEAFSSGCPSPLPELSLQYTDFARWQREWLQGEVLDAQMSYWKGQLGSAPTVLELPTDRPHPATQTFHGARQSRVWPRSFGRALKALSQREGVTLFMTLLAAFQVLLYRYTGQTDLVVGSPVAGRNRTELEDLIGFFVNTLVLRADLSGQPTFRELLHRVRETLAGAYAHQDLPFEKLVEELQLARDLSRNPLFQVMFALQNAPMPALELPELTLTPLEADSGTARFDLTVSVWDTPQGLRGVWEYNTDLFDARTIERMQEHYQTLLGRIVANEKGAEQSLSDLSPLTDAERQQLLVVWNDTDTAYAEDKCIHELFEAQAKQTPDTVAVVFEDGCLSYDKLDRQANRLAHHLQWLGVGPEVLVGIYVERSLEMLVGLLAILKAGGAYIPLDPVYPQERLAFMLEDTQAPVLLTQRHLLDKLPAHQAQVVCLDSDWATMAARPQTAPPCATAVNNLAYTIYTSGSTGRPKGVQVLHGAVVNFLAAMRRRPGLTAQDVILSVTTLSFDIAVLELFLPLNVGARVVLVERAVAADGVRLMETLAASEATVMQATPATWQLLLAAGWQGDGQLRVLCGGEAFPRELAHHLLACAGSVWNLYGPTETTVWSTTYALTTLDDLIPVGRPIANTEVYLLDPHLQLVPIGVPGELYIGGAGLARGYLHRPRLSAQRFVPDPFSPPGGDGQKPKGGARLYRTGDLARYRPDGNIEFLGRADYQVKLRGFRIELGEVETVLSAHPRVQESVVLVREDQPGNRRLVAYLVAVGEPMPTAAELRRFLQGRLPEYMIPSAFVTLAALPLTPNGKVDRRALPAPDQMRSELEGAFVAPRDDFESDLARIFENTLGVSPIGIADDFFELGGNSLLAGRLMHRIKERFGWDIPLAALFKQATIGHLAGILHELEGSLQQQVTALRRLGMTSTSGPRIAAPRPNGPKLPFFCATFFGGIVPPPMDLTILARHLASDQPFYMIQPPVFYEDWLQHHAQFQAMDDRQIQTLYQDWRPNPQIIGNIAADCVQRIRAIQPRGPYCLGGVCSGAILAFEMAQQLQKQRLEIALLVLLDAVSPIREDTSAAVAIQAISSGDMREVEIRLLSQFAAWDLGQGRIGEIQVIRKILEDLEPDERWSYILEQTKAVHVVPSDVQLEEIRYLYRVFKMNLLAISSTLQDYMPHFYSGQVTLIHVGEGHLAENVQRIRGWDEITSEPIRTYRTSGEHGTMLKEPHVQVMAEILTHCLNEAQSFSSERS